MRGGAPRGGGGVSSPGASSSLTWPSSSYTTNQTATKGNGYPMDCTSAARTVAAPSSPAVGDTFGVTKTDSSANVVTLTGTFEGQTNATITAQYAGATFTYFGGSIGWKITDSYTVTGPQGIRGIQGIQGDPGIQGPPGTIGQIQDHGTNVTQRGTLDFEGGGVTITDDAAGSRTKVTIPTSVVVPRGRPVPSGGNTYYVVPGGHPTGTNSQTQSANRIVYEPILVTTDITLDQIAIVVTAAGAVSTTARVALYTADVNWQPVTLVGEPTSATQLDVSGTGTKTSAFAQTLTAGRYLWAVNNSGGPTFAVTTCAHEWTGLNPVTATMNLPISWYVASTYGAFPSTPVAWTNVNTGNAGFYHSVLARVSTP